ncbi:hypothetical protein KC19_4G025300 [Ceratodon purpureus]|uniref:Uncharacterized protein n=1 Tax=Ceratodon purpureus TaxID=3225 RepID=A0A8T0I5V0_CERPU|nr:hypothetical protein KC19_4G025300 [Ceratodon purpureus]
MGLHYLKAENTWIKQRIDQATCLLGLLHGSLHTQQHEPNGNASERERAHDGHNLENLRRDVAVGSQCTPTRRLPAPASAHASERLLGALRHPHARHPTLRLQPSEALDPPHPQLGLGLGRCRCQRRRHHGGHGHGGGDGGGCHCKFEGDGDGCDRAETRRDESGDCNLLQGGALAVEMKIE